jgi:hypothetical protein
MISSTSSKCAGVNDPEGPEKYKSTEVKSTLNIFVICPHYLLLAWLFSLCGVISAETDLF